MVQIDYTHVSVLISRAGSSVVVIMGNILATKDTHGGLFLHLFLAVRAVAAFAFLFVVGFLVQFGVGHLPGLAVQVVLDGGVQGVGSQVGAVKLVGRQAPQGCGHIGVGDLHGFGEGFAPGHFGDHAGTVSYTHLTLPTIYSV